MDPHDMLNICSLKFDNPSCFWGRLVGSNAPTSKQYDHLFSQMNLFYLDVTQDLRKLQPTFVEEGQVCVAYWSGMKSWCRALVEEIVMDSVAWQAHCFLVDHGEQLICTSEQIRVAEENFLQLPFWVRRFHLAGIKPTTLRVSLFEEKAELIPSGQWDSSATLYLHNLLQASTHTDAVLVESGSDSTAIELYLTVRNIKICVNDDLVVKKFAYYSRGSDKLSALDEADRHPVMFSSRTILTQCVCTTPKEPTAQALPPPVMSLAGPGVGAGDWLAASSPPQSPRRESETSEGGRGSKVTGQLSPCSQSDEDSNVAAESDSSLAAALTNNLSLFRFLKFLNPGSSFQQAAVSVNFLPATFTKMKVSEHDQLHVCQPDGTTGSSSSCKGLEDSSSRSEESEPAAVEQRWSSEEDWACSRFLEWLNPEPLGPDEDAAGDPLLQVVPSDPRTGGVLVHAAFPVEPCTGLEDAPVTDHLRQVLKRKQLFTLSMADRHSWPTVARGCNTIIISPHAEQPLSYLPPLLTHILLNSVFTSLTASTGPIAVLLCPGWEKVAVVSDLLEESKVVHALRPAVVLLGVGKDEAKHVRIPKNCLLVVTTPFSLVRLLSHHCFLFLRLYHLVLDEADQLFTLAADQMATILQHFQKVTSSKEKASCPQQLVAVAKRWTSHMEGLLTKHMPCPCIIMTSPEEAALYGNVQQIILMTLESSKISALLGALDFHPDAGQKTVIVANSAEEVDDVFKAVSNKSAVCLMIREGLTHQFDSVIEQWGENLGPGSHVVLVTTDECLRCLGIQDATCVVHFDVPTSSKLFGSRLSCMVQNFRNLSEHDPAESCPPAIRSLLLVSERNARHVSGLLRYLRRTNAFLPSELLSFAEGIHVACEDQKTTRPLCSYLKSFGVCRDSSVCPDRHRLVSQLDQSDLPASGVVNVVPLYIKTASVYYGRIVRKEDSGFASMADEMASYYVGKKPVAVELQEGGLYAVQEEDVFHRVKLLSVPDQGDRLFFRVLVRFIDVGKEEEVKFHQVFQLPEMFHSLPDQAVEIIVCRVKPVDAETDWHPKVTRAVSQRIRGLQHRARAVLSLGNTVFVDAMVRVTKVPGMKTEINEYSVHSLILNTGMGEGNPGHPDLLRVLCQEAVSGAGREATDITGSGEGLTSLDASIEAEDKVLAEAFRAELKKLAAHKCLIAAPAASSDLHLASGPHQKPRSEIQRNIPAGDRTAGSQAARLNGCKDSTNTSEFCQLQVSL